MSQISVITAKIGGGKSLYATGVILEELRQGERSVVTNVPLFVDSAPVGCLTVGEWCHEHVQRSVDVKSRVRILTEEEVLSFWLHYPGWEMGYAEAAELKDSSGAVVMVRVPDLQSRVRRMLQGDMPFGTLFVIDEAHISFGARNWQKVSRGCETYVSQLRHLNDDLCLVTQHPEKLDKNLRRNATRWIYLRNLGSSAMWLGVRLAGRFRYAEFLEEPRFGDKPVASGHFTLRGRQYEKCYATMAGHGLKVGLQPEKQKKGVGPWVWVLAVIVLVSLCFKVPWLIGKVTSVGARAASRSLRGGVVESSVVKTSVDHGSLDHGSLDVENIAAFHAVPVESVIRRREVHVSTTWSRDVIVEGWRGDGQAVDVWLSDGTVWSRGDGHFTGWDGENATIDGTIYRWLNNRERAAWERKHVFAPTTEDRPKGAGFRVSNPGVSGVN